MARGFRQLLGVLPALSKRNRWVKTCAFWAGLMYALYVLFGVFAAPSLIERYAVNGALASRIALSIDSVQVNPFVLSVSFRGVSVADQNGEEFLGIEHAYLNFDLLGSFFSRKLSLKKVQLSAPSLLVEKEREGGFNLSSVGPKPRENSEPSKPIDLVVRSLEISDGRVMFRDAGRAAPFSVALTAFELKATAIGTNEKGNGGFELSLVSPHGGSLIAKGEVSLSPLYLNTFLKLDHLDLPSLGEYLQDRLDFDITSGQLGSSGRLTLAYQEGQPEVVLSQGVLSVENFKATSPDFHDEPSVIAEAWLEEINLDAFRRELSIGSLRGKNAAIAAKLVNGPKVFRTVFGGVGGAGGPDQNTGKPWKISLKDAELSGFNLVLDDERASPPLRTEMAQTVVHLRNMRSEPGSPLKGDLKTSIQGQGELAMDLEGTFRPLSLQIKTDLKKLPLAHFNPYLAPYVRLHVREGEGSVTARAEITEGGQTPVVKVSADAALEKLNLIGSDEAQTIGGCKEIKLEGLQISTVPPSLHLSKIAASGLDLSIVREEDGSLALAKLLPEARPQDSEQQAPQSSIAIDAIEVSKSKMIYKDLSLGSPVELVFTDLDGKVDNLAVGQSSPMKIRADGILLPRAPVKMRAEYNPKAKPALNIFDISLNDADMAKFSGYVERAAGRIVKSGEISLALNYKTQESLFRGSNKILIKGISLGGQTKDPKASSMPLDLAIALLQDLDGKIAIDFPVEKRADEMQYEYGSVVVQALRNVISRLIASPFSALSSLTGSESGLDRCEFEFGRADLSFEWRQKLSQLASALNKRPALNLSLLPRYDPAEDERAIQEDVIRLNLERLKNGERADLRAPSEPPNKHYELDKEEYALYLQRLYQTVFGQSPQNVRTAAKAGMINHFAGVKSNLTPAQLAAVHAALSEKIAVPEAVLAKLAALRAERIKSFLAEENQISADRVLIGPVQGAKFEDAVAIPMTLEARH